MPAAELLWLIVKAILPLVLKLLQALLDRLNAGESLATFVSLLGGLDRRGDASPA